MTKNQVEILCVIISICIPCLSFLFPKEYLMLFLMVANFFFGVGVGSRYLARLE